MQTSTNITVHGTPRDPVLAVNDGAKGSRWIEFKSVDGDRMNICLFFDSDYDRMQFMASVVGYFVKAIEQMAERRATFSAEQLEQVADVLP